MRKSWHIAPESPAARLNEYRSLSPIMAQILHNRGISPDQTAHFLFAKDYLGDPFQIHDMERAVMRIRLAIKEGEKIAVYGDFDADGVTSTALMMQVLRKLKADAIPYIPLRVEEGYGLNTPALLDLQRQGVSLVITVDCGIRSVEEVRAAKEAGLDIIITDHHSLGPELPEADALVNPQLGSDPDLKTLAGVGVAFMVMRALLLDAAERNGRASVAVYKRIIDDLLDLVAIGTIADIMALNSFVNRSWVRRGLELINTGQRIGLQALMKEAGVTQGQVSAMSIGFGIGPRINAAGRLADAMSAVNLLLAETEVQATHFAKELDHLNSQRQQLTTMAQSRILQQIEQDGQSAGSLIFAVDKEVQPGIVGLVAGRLTEMFYRPAIVMEYGPDESRASCRSIPQFNITRALDECADLLVRHGGHALAAGFTVQNDNIDILRERLMHRADEALQSQDVSPTLHIDLQLDTRQIHAGLLKELSMLEPTGHQNERPVFMTRDVAVMDKRGVGGDRSHLKLKLAGSGSITLDAIGFRMGDYLSDLPDRVDVAYQLEMNEWQGRQSVQLNLQDIRPVQSEASV